MKNKILLGEGDEHIQELVKEQVVNAGLEILLAKNGQEALEIFEKERKSIFIIVLDRDMSKLSGEECLKKIMDIDPTAGVFISTSADPKSIPEEIERLTCEGALLVIQKSPSFLTFFQRLGNLLN